MEGAFKEIAQEISRITDLEVEDVKLDTRLLHDAGLSGVDYYDFLMWFSARFNVDFSGFKTSDFTPPEVESIWGFGILGFKKKKFFELKVRDLIDIIDSGSWVSSDVPNRLIKS